MTAAVLSEDRLEPAALDGALREHGGFYVQLSRRAGLLDRMLAAGRAFVALPDEDRAALAIEASPHFRGWSEMRNERDWREQLHLARELPAVAGEGEFWRLQGPNRWPADPAWRQVVSSYMEAAAELGQRLLDGIARALGVDPASFGPVGRDGYLVAKLIAYHPQPSPLAVRPGVAAHVDFSLLTINLQDSAGLDARSPDGRWTPVEVRPGAVWVHAGELLEHATAGRYRATPHRVVNPSSTRTRLSIPAFVNPPLDAMVSVLARPRAAATAAPAREPAGDHVHRVLRPATRYQGFHFGRAEWRRKGEGRWCFACQYPTRSVYANSCVP